MLKPNCGTFCYSPVTLRNRLSRKKSAKPENFFGNRVDPGGGVVFSDAALGGARGSAGIAGIADRCTGRKPHLP